MPRIIPLACILLPVLFAGGFAASPLDEAKDPVIGSEAPTFSLLTVDGERFYLRDYCGELRQPWKGNIKYPLVISFFSSICEPCKKEITELHKLEAKYRPEIKFFLIDVGETPQVVKQCLRERGYTLPTLLDQYMVVTKMFGNPQVVPKLAVIDREGKIAFFIKGYEADNIAKLDRILAEMTAVSK